MAQPLRTKLPDDMSFLIISISDMKLGPNMKSSSLKKHEVGKTIEEPFLSDDNGESCAKFSIKHKDIWELYKKSESSFWTAEEIDIQNDQKDWIELNSSEKRFIAYVVGYLALADKVVNSELSMDLCCDIKCSEARCFYGFQMAIENIHNEVYNMLLQIFEKEYDFKYKLFAATHGIPLLSKKIQWSLQKCNRNVSSIAERLVSFAAVEGIFFCGSFCSISWLKKRGVMPGLVFSNELITRDESLHCQFACLIYKKLTYSLPQAKIFEIIGDAVEIESEFVRDAIPVELIGMNSGMMIEYIKFCADGLLQALGYEKLYNVKNPFDWIDDISPQGKGGVPEAKTNATENSENIPNNAEGVHTTSIGLSFTDF